MQDDDVRVLNPLTFINQFMIEDDRIIDMKFVLNDTFLVVVTEQQNILFFDPLLQVYNIQPRTQDSFDQLPYINMNENLNSNWRIFGWRNEVNVQGLPI